jgi:pyruvate formate lyase activating enzyme
MSGEYLTVEQVMEVVEKDRTYYENSGGGVTFSVGEPTMQPEFLLACLKCCRQSGLHTAIDTNGHVQWPVLEELLPNIDLFLYDIKHMDSGKHKQFTGVGNELILENLRKIDRLGNSTWLRVPLIPDYNDDDENIQRVAELAGSLKAVEKVSLLSYNRLAGAKYQFIGKGYELEHLEAHSKEREKALMKMFFGLGKKVELGR